jgi:hypothetical protein
MKPILSTMTILALLVGISGCLFVRDRWHWRDDRDDRYEQAYRGHSGSDCWSDGRRICRDGD